MRNCIFTAIIGKHDWLKEPEYITPGWDYICFTDDPNLKSEHWEVRLIDNPEDVDSCRLARRVKHLYYEYVPDYDLTIWADACRMIIGDLNKFVKKVLPDDPEFDFAIAINPRLDCIYREGAWVVRNGLDGMGVVRAQLDRYRAEGYPPNNGLVGSAIIVRRMGRKNVEEHFRRIYKEIRRFSKRDQLSYDFILWKYDLVKVSLFPWKLTTAKFGVFREYLHGLDGGLR